MIHAQKPESSLKSEMHKILWDFEIETDDPVPTRSLELVIINKKKERERNLTVLWTLPSQRTTEWKSKIMQREKNLDLARELRKLCNMKVTVRAIVIATFGIVPKGLQRGLEEWKLEEESRPSKLQHCWDRPEYREESWRLEETYCHSGFSENHQLKHK